MNKFQRLLAFRHSFIWSSDFVKQCFARSADSRLRTKIANFYCPCLIYVSAKFCQFLPIYSQVFRTTTQGMKHCIHWIKARTDYPLNNFHPPSMFTLSSSYASTTAIGRSCTFNNGWAISSEPHGGSSSRSPEKLPSFQSVTMPNLVAQRLSCTVINLYQLMVCLSNHCRHCCRKT